MNTTAEKRSPGHMLWTSSAPHTRLSGGEPAIASLSAGYAGIFFYSLPCQGQACARSFYTSLASEYNLSHG